MNKTEYILNQLNKTGSKKFERYVVHKIFDDLNNLDLKFTCQQYVKRSKNHALIDMYFPSIFVQIEVDEAHHNNSNNIDADKERQKEIDENVNKDIEAMSALERTQIIDTPNLSELEIIRINVYDDKTDVCDLKVINSQIDVALEKIRNRIQKLNPEPWNYESEFSWRRYQNQRFIYVANNVELRYVSDIHNLFGGTDDGSEFEERAQSRVYWAYPKGQSNWYIWCPKKGHDKWDNKLDTDGQMINEKINNPSKSDESTKLSDESTKLRITFYQSRDNLGQTFYRFVGVFKLAKVVDGYNQYARVEDFVEIKPVSSD